MKRVPSVARMAALLVGLLVLDLQAPPIADACGVKLIVKNPTPRHNHGAPVRAKSDPVVASGPARKPIKTGPDQPPVVATKEPDKPKQPEPAPPPPPAPEPVAVKTEPTPPPAPEPVHTAPAPKVAAASSFKAQEIYFGTNSATPNKASIAKAAKQLAADTSINITLEGYADPTGNSSYNMILSQNRAEAVRDALAAAGVDASRMQVQAFGDTKLKYGKADGRNRRVAIVPDHP